MSIFVGYTYLIGWSKLDKWYYGCRYAKNCTVGDLFTTYFTSSDFVKCFIEQNGKPDVIQVRKQFIKREDALTWEQKVLRRLKIINNSRWLNQAYGSLKIWKSGHQQGKFNSMYGRKRPDTAEYNRTRIHPLLGKERPQHSKAMSGKNNPMFETKLLFWTDGKETIRSEKSPGSKWKRGMKPRTKKNKPRVYKD